MRALLSFIVSTTLFASLRSAGVVAAAEPFNWSPQVDDPIHTPAELVESMHSAFGYNHCRVVHAKGIILQGEFTPDTHAKEITKAPHLQGGPTKSQAASKLTKLSHDNHHGKPSIYYYVLWMAARSQRSLCLRTKNLHMNEPDFRDYPRLPDEQAENILAMRDDVGVSAPDRGSALGSISDISQRQCLKDRNEEFVARNEDE